MLFISERWELLKEALGAARYGLPNVIRAVVALAALAYVGWYGYAMNWLESGGLLLAVGFALLFWIVLEFALRLKRQIREARVDLSKLRRRGVELRNFGQSQIASVETFDTWMADTLQWHNDVVACISKISVADAEWFAILDSYPDAPREPLKKPFMRASGDFEHAKRFAQHDFQLKRLGEMIRDLWGRN